MFDKLTNVYIHEQVSRIAQKSEYMIKVKKYAYSLW